MNSASGDSIWPAMSSSARQGRASESAKASVAADFSTEPNDGGSEILRWEIKDPVAKNTGFILQFKVKVR